MTGDNLKCSVLELVSLRGDNISSLPPPQKKKKNKEAGSCYLLDVLLKISDEHHCTFYIHVGVPPGREDYCNPFPPLSYARQKKVINRKIRKIGRHSIEMLLNFICFMLLISHCQCLVSKRLCSCC